MTLADILKVQRDALIEKAQVSLRLTCLKDEGHDENVKKNSILAHNLNVNPPIIAIFVQFIRDKKDTHINMRARAY